MKNPFAAFKRHKIQAVTIHNVESAQVTNPEVSAEAEMVGLKLFHKVAQTAMVASQIRDELASGALAELRGRSR